MREYSIGVPQDLEPVLGGEHVRRLEAIGRRRTVRRGDVIYRQGEPAAHVFLLIGGTVQSVLLSSAGQESLLRIHLPGSILGLTALASVPWRDATARAADDAELGVIERERLKQTLREDPELALLLIRLLVDRMRDFHFRVGDLNAQPVEHRLARALLTLSQGEEPGAGAGVRSIRLTHQELAHLVNASRQTVSAVLSRFAEAGLIERRGRVTVLADAARLEATLPGSLPPSSLVSAG